MKRGYLIFNPFAGQRLKSKSLIAQAIRDFADVGIEMTPSPTEPDGSVVKMVRELLRENPDLMVAWGGDGTINEVVNGMFGSNVPLGALPGGTANLFVREMKIPLDLSGAIRLIGEGKTRSISVGQANHRYFVLMVGIGFDSAVIRNVDWNLKRKFGKLAFGLSFLNTARSYDYPKFSVNANGAQRDCVFAVICNAREYAAYFVLTPEANISDEYFYVCLFKEAGLGNMSRYVFHALNRSHHKLDDVEILKVSDLEVTGPDTIAVQADGELVGALPMRFRIHPQSLNVFCP